MKNLESIYELKGCFAPELLWYRNECGNVEVETNGRFYLIVELSIIQFILVIKKGMKRLGEIEIERK